MIGVCIRVVKGRDFRPEPENVSSNLIWDPRNTLEKPES